MVLIQSYLNAAFYRCEYIKNFPGLGKDEKLFKYKWLFKILLLMLDSFPKVQNSIKADGIRRP